MPEKPRILILTAAFGEGHNSAARNLSLALKAMGAETRVADPCVLSMPNSTALMQWGYRLVTTHFPRVWEAIYRGTDECDFSRPDIPLMRHPESYLEGLVAEYKPHALTFLGNNTATVFTLPTDKQAASTDKMAVYHLVASTGVITDVSGTVTLATDDVTFGTAPATGDSIFVVYEYA